MKILVADDSQSLLLYYKKELERRGHEVIIVHDGVECLQVYHRQVTVDNNSKDKSNFDLVILDQKMPGMDGINVAKEIQKSHPKQRILFITAYGKEVLMGLKKIEEKVEVMNKPFSPKALSLQVEGWSIHQWKDMVKRGFVEWDGYSGTSIATQ